MIVVIDYGVGNLSSIENMFKKKFGVLALKGNLVKRGFARSSMGKGKTVRFRQDAMENLQKVSNMSWLNVKPSGQSALLSGIEEPRFYFTLSFHVVLREAIQTRLIATCGYDLVAGIENRNITGV